MILLSSTGENIFQLIIVLFCFLIVLALTYYVTRWIAGYQKSQSISKNLSVVETLKLTTNKYIQLITQRRAVKRNAFPEYDDPDG